jgi:hypothetical protein
MDIFDFFNMNCLFDDSLNLVKKLGLFIQNEEDTISLLEICSNHYNDLNKSLIIIYKMK